VVDVDLERDAFSVCFDAGRVMEEQIERVIRVLGFQPRQAGPEELEAREGATLRGDVPDPVAGLLARARREGRHVLLDFYADWCAPCKVIDTEILPDSRVRQALEGYVVLRVDAEEFPVAFTYFEVAAMPTLLVLDASGRELQRFEGVPQPDEFAAHLTSLRAAAPVAVDEGAGHE